MKRLCAILVLISLTVGVLVGCKKKYKPVESTEEEARIVMTLSLGDSKYEVRYELYRALFLTYRSEIDGGNEDAWSGEDKAKYIEKINTRITDELCEIFSVFELCARIGYNLYSKEVEKQIEDMIRVSVEGGSYGGENYSGFGGDYDAYLDSLRAMYHNYSTSVLLLRYQIGREMLEDHYIGEALPYEVNGKLTDGALDYTAEDVQNFYYSDGAVRILQTYVPEEISYTPRDMAEGIRNDIIEAAKSGDEAVRIMMINRGTPTAVAELESGILLGKYSLARDYAALSAAAFELEDGGVSDVIETVSALDGRRFYILYRAEKTEEFLTENYASVVEVYLYDAIGAVLNSTAEALGEFVEYTKEYASITHDKIRI